MCARVKYISSLYQRINSLIKELIYFPTVSHLGLGLTHCELFHSISALLMFYWFAEGLLATSGDWSLNSNLQTLLTYIAFINRWDEHLLKLWWFKYKGAGHSMMFINECMHLSDHDSDTLLHRLLSESILLNMNLKWSVDLLIESQLWHHSQMFSTTFGLWKRGD